MSNITPLNRSPDPAILSDTVNRIIADHNRTDERSPLYADDVGSGTAYVMKPIPGIKLAALPTLG